MHHRLLQGRGAGIDASFSLYLSFFHITQMKSFLVTICLTAFITDHNYMLRFS